MKPYVVGITGGIAGGKTAVTDELTALGASVIDTDVLSREVTAAGSKGEKKLARAFPSAFVNGKPDRRALRSIVFSDDKMLKRLNKITHPLIKKKAKRLIRQERGVVFFAVPLLFETDFYKLCDYTVTVYADESIRIKRLLKRNTELTEADAEAMLAAQTSDAERIRRADEVLVNNGTTEELKRLTRELYTRITERAR